MDRSVPYTVKFNPEYPSRLEVCFPEEGWAQVIRYQDWCDETLKNMTEWCIDRECGRRTSWNHFTFNSIKDMSMFLLRWR